MPRLPPAFFSAQREPSAQSSSLRSCTGASTITPSSAPFNGIYTSAGAPSQQISGGGSSTGLVDVHGTPQFGLESCITDAATGQTMCFQWAYTNVEYNMVMDGTGILRVQKHNSNGANIVTSWDSQYTNCKFKITTLEDPDGLGTAPEILRSEKVYNLLASNGGDWTALFVAKNNFTFSYLALIGNGVLPQSPDDPNVVRVKLSYGQSGVKNKALCLDRNFKITLPQGVDDAYQELAPRDGRVGFYSDGGAGFYLIPPTDTYRTISHPPKIPYETRAVYFTPGWTCADLYNGKNGSTSICNDLNSPQQCTAGGSANNGLAAFVMKTDPIFSANGPSYFCDC